MRTLVLALCLLLVARVTSQAEFDGTGTTSVGLVKPMQLLASQELSRAEIERRSCDLMAALGEVMNATLGVPFDQRANGRFLYLFVSEGMLRSMVEPIFPDESPVSIPMQNGKVILLWFDYGVYVHLGLDGRVCRKFLFPK